MWPTLSHLGRGFLEQLMKALHEVDGAILIFGEDDLIEYRGEPRWAPRDNVLFEYGLFMGFLGRENVAVVRVGNAKIPTDFPEIIYASFPIVGGSAAKTRGERKRAFDEAHRLLLHWASELTPAYLIGLSKDLAKRLALTMDGEVSVDHLLGGVASRLVAQNATSEIRALCSEKGKAMAAYYAMQFEWAATAEARGIRRVFVRSRTEMDGRKGYGFSPGEIEGINLHLDAAHHGIDIRWIYADHRRLGGPYSKKLGFALFGDSWLVHWGLEAGAYHEATESTGGGNRAVLDLLSDRFEDIWASASEFDASLKADVRRSREGAPD
jgi:hypothetical protein